MKLKSIYVILFFASIIGLPGCSYKQKPVHRFRPLTALRPKLNFEQYQNNVSLEIRILNKKDCIKLFGKAGRRLVSQNRHPFVPLHIHITNHSDKTYLLHPDDIDLPLATNDAIANRIKPNVSIKTIGTVLGGVFLSGLVASTGAGLLIAGATFASPLLILSGSTACVSSAALLFIGTPIATVMSNTNATKKCISIQQDIAHKTLTHAIRIEADSARDLLIFVPRRTMKKQFNITLQQKNAQEKMDFAIHLK